MDAADAANVARDQAEADAAAAQVAVDEASARALTAQAAAEQAATRADHEERARVQVEHDRDLLATQVADLRAELKETRTGHTDEMKALRAEHAQALKDLQVATLRAGRTRGSRTPTRRGTGATARRNRGGRTAGG